MPVDSIGSSQLAAALLQSQRAPEAAESKRGGPDRDGDSDDKAGTAPVSGPVVNTSGQTTGLLVNAKA